MFDKKILHINMSDMVFIFRHYSIQNIHEYHTENKKKKTKKKHLEKHILYNSGFYESFSLLVSLARNRVLDIVVDSHSVTNFL